MLLNIHIEESFRIRNKNFSSEWPFNGLHWMFKIGLRSVLGAITNACVAKKLKQLNRGHVLYLFGSHLVQNQSFLRLCYNMEA
jgi:hypothetical protein